MPQTVEATIDPLGQVILLEEVRLKSKHNALVTILDEVEQPENGDSEWSLFGSVEIIDEDLEAASREISEMFNSSIERSGKEISEND
jgi:hypothetical protein